MFIETHCVKIIDVYLKVICILTPPPTPFQDRGCILDQLTRIQGYQVNKIIVSQIFKTFNNNLFYSSSPNVLS